MCRLLRGAGAPVDDGARLYDGSTVMHIAACSGNLEGLEYLYRIGVPIDARDERGCTPLMAASLEAVELSARLTSEKGVDAPYSVWCADEFESGSGVVNWLIVDPTIVEYSRRWSEAAFGGDGLPEDGVLVPLRKMAQRVAKEERSAAPI